MSIYTTHQETDNGLCLAFSAFSHTSYSFALLLITSRLPRPVRSHTAVYIMAACCKHHEKHSCLNGFIFQNSRFYILETYKRCYQCHIPYFSMLGWSLVLCSFCLLPNGQRDACCSCEGHGRGLSQSCDSGRVKVNLFNLCTESCALWTANNALRITKGHKVRVRAEVINIASPSSVSLQQIIHLFNNCFSFFWDQCIKPLRFDVFLPTIPSAERRFGRLLTAG